ncbi:hypothetical protein NBRC116601_05550 [Cognatishimia sp. WU-CL00825]|uniref:hypothetical protein n=1 Tax=Cognatishimia sp. WU-CL00825 TaxID=3127658 RepID=UPI0031071E7C
MMKYFWISTVFVAVTGCAQVEKLGLGKKTPSQSRAAPADPALGLVRPVARGDLGGDLAKSGAEQLDLTSKTGTKSGVLGVTIASLGDARQPGMWLKTPLVEAPQPGQVIFGSKSADVQLLPLDGPLTAGSQISLQAMQALGAPLTGLPELKVRAF